MAYITKNNADRILRCTSVEVDTTKELYPKKLYMFTSREIKHLLRYKTLMENPNEYFATYKKITKRADTFTLVTEYDSPTYHYDKQCDVLNAKFFSYVIPESIQLKGEAKCTEFRKWFYFNKALLETDPTKFYEALKKKYGVSELDTLEKENSGIVQFTDKSVDELEKDINKLVQEYNVYSHKPDVLPILRKYRNHIFYVKLGYTIPEITTDHTNEEIVNVLLTVKETYKKPLETMLKTYFRAKYNPELYYDESILEQLGFKPCSHCCK